MIRECIKEDIEKINEIGLLIKADFNNTNNIEDILNHDYSKIFVYEDKEIKGFIEIEIHYEIIDIINIAVKEKYQNQGIASKLLEYIINNFKCDKVLLEVRENNKKAINFYSKHGFIEIHRRKNYYKEEDAIIMERSI